MAFLWLLYGFYGFYGLPMDYKYHSRKIYASSMDNPTLQRVTAHATTHHLWIIIDDLWINLNLFLVTVLKYCFPHV